jgi:hypothetical protein
MASHDIFLWTQQVQAQLPAGQVVVTYDGAAVPPEYTIDVQWVEAGDALNYSIKFPVRAL